MVHKYNETVSAKVLSDLREAVGWNRMEKGFMRFDYICDNMPKN